MRVRPTLPNDDHAYWDAAVAAEIRWQMAERAYWWSVSGPSTSHNPYVTEEFPDPYIPRDAELRERERNLAWEWWYHEIASIGEDPHAVRRERGGWYGDRYRHRDGSYRLPGRDLLVRRGRSATYAPWEWDATHEDLSGVARYDSSGQPYYGMTWLPLFPDVGMS